MYNNFGQFYNGKWNVSEDKSTYEVINPCSEEVIGNASNATMNDVDKALRSASLGLKKWSQYPAWQRSSILRKAADLIRENREIIAKYISLEVGKPLKESLGEVDGAADIFEWNSEETKRIFGKTVESRFSETRVNIYYQPVGVVAALIPWNFPCALAARKLSTSLAAGCSVICKPDTIAPGSVMSLVDIISKAGFPEGAINLLSGDPAKVSERLIASDIIKKVSITGSTRVGKIILKQAADKVQRVTMELSGHAPFIVYSDADINKAVEMAVAVKYRNNGQVCISASRFYIHEKIKSEFQKLFVEKTKKLTIGDSLGGKDLGPITTKKRLEDVEKLVSQTIKEGGKILCGGKRPPEFNKGYYFEPTVFDNIEDNFTIMTEEPFAPLSPILSFKNFNEVIDRANHHDNGLAAYVCTSSMSTAHKTADALEAGMVSINTPVVAVAEAPFGGIKQSGYGREGGSDAIKDYLNTKYLHLGLEG
jgi:succinate-semialdehyde dehydrogenase / glutarate-semialdehyde dehydrogenase